MTEQDTATPWWQTQLPWLSEQLARLANRHRLGADAQDAIQDTLAALTANMTRRPAHVAPEWIAGEPPADVETERRKLAAYARTILRRRLADRYRKRAVRWRYAADERDAEQIPASDRPALDELVARELVAAGVAALAALSEQEIELLRLAIDGFDLDRAMTPAERQRLTRARRRVARAIVDRLQEEHGPEIARLFEEEYLR